MAIIRCPECEKEISDKAISCPHCGFPLRETAGQDNSSTNIETVKTAFPLASITKTLTNEFSKNKKVFIGAIAVALVVLIISVCTPKLGKHIYTGVKPGMTVGAVVSKLENNDKCIIETDFRGSYSSVYITPIARNEFQYFGYTPDYIEAWGANAADGNTGRIERVEANFDLKSLPVSETLTIENEIVEQLAKLGTCVHYHTGRYDVEYTYSINGTKYEIYFYIYRGPSGNMMLIDFRFVTDDTSNTFNSDEIIRDIFSLE